LCKHLVAAQQRVESDTAAGKREAADQARDYAERDEGFIRNIWYHLNGERARRAHTALVSSHRAGEADARVSALADVVADLARRGSTTSPTASPAGSAAACPARSTPGCRPTTCSAGSARRPRCPRAATRRPSASRAVACSTRSRRCPLPTRVTGGDRATGSAAS